MRRKPILTGVIIAGMLLAAAPMAQADESDLTVDVLDTLAVTDTQADVPGYDNNQSSGSFRFPEDVDDDAYGSKADMWDVIYMRDFDPATIKSDDGDVSYGVLRNDPYSGRDVTYEKGGASEIDIEHVVARSEAWDSGASEWTQAQRDAFANDPLEILAVSSGGNRAHGEKDAAGWLPSVGVKFTGVNNPAYDCLYVARQIAVKDKYDLSVDKDEKNAMSDVLATCPAQTIPDEQDGAYWENDTPSTGLAGDVNGDGKYTTGDLTGLTAVVDGEPYKEFTPDTDSYKLPDGDHTVTIAGTPDGWTMTPGMRSSQTPMPDGPIVTTTTYAFTYTAPNGVTVASYTFTWGTVEHTDDGDDDTSDTPPVVDDTDTDNPDTNAGTDTVPDATDTDDPDSGNTTETPADQLASTGAPITGIGAFTLAMLCCGAALGVLLRHRTRN
ncbi:HNH endonuclease [Bifidobacterium pullorum subsp. saeculare]|uniref:HNH endonuclease family protein n=1 Tax=Bifidobacterium pullorum TaxID=78448 RepID=UPI00195CFEC6|nr:HNH endonuclease family protein [Bifidobacterium pullorum]MBM6706089.1 HNH endonuclease [Bifidobacterium pullorum subsp. saeculare]